MDASSSSTMTFPVQVPQHLRNKLQYARRTSPHPASASSASPAPRPDDHLLVFEYPTDSKQTSSQRAVHGPIDAYRLNGLTVRRVRENLHARVHDHLPAELRSPKCIMLYQAGRILLSDDRFGVQYRPGQGALHLYYVVTSLAPVASPLIAKPFDRLRWIQEHEVKLFSAEQLARQRSSTGFIRNRSGRQVFRFVRGTTWAQLHRFIQETAFALCDEFQASYWEACGGQQVATSSVTSKRTWSGFCEVILPDRHRFKRLYTFVAWGEEVGADGYCVPEVEWDIVWGPVSITPPVSSSSDSRESDGYIFKSLDGVPAHLDTFPSLVHALHETCSVIHWRARPDVAKFTRHVAIAVRIASQAGGVHVDHEKLWIVLTQDHMKHVVLPRGVDEFVHVWREDMMYSMRHDDDDEEEEDKDKSPVHPMLWVNPHALSRESDMLSNSYCKAKPFTGPTTLVNLCNPYGVGSVVGVRLVWDWLRAAAGVESTLVRTELKAIALWRAYYTMLVKSPTQRHVFGIGKLVQLPTPLDREHELPTSANYFDQLDHIKSRLLTRIIDAYLHGAVSVQSEFEPMLDLVVSHLSDVDESDLHHPTTRSLYMWFIEWCLLFPGHGARIRSAAVSFQSSRVCELTLELVETLLFHRQGGDVCGLSDAKPKKPRKHRAKKSRGDSQDKPAGVQEPDDPAQLIDQLVQNGESLAEHVRAKETKLEHAQREIDTLRYKNSDLERRMESLELHCGCVICADGETKATVLLMPCKHLCLCNACSTKYLRQNCPLCKTTIRQRISGILM